MAKFQPVSPKFWQDPKVRQWPDHQKLLATYLLTCPHRTTEGLFWLPHGYVAQDLGWSIERVSEGYSGLVGAGFVAYDDTSETVLLRKALKYGAPAGPKQIQGAIIRLADVPPSPLFPLLRDAALQYAPEFGKALDDALEHGALQHHRYPTDTPPDGYPSRARGNSSSSSSSNSTSDTGAIAPAPARASRSPRAALVVVEPDPPAETAQTVLGAYIDWRRQQGVNGIDRRTTGLLAKQLGQAFQAGHPPDIIKRGLVAWHERDQHPSTLASFIDVEARGGQARASPGKAQRQLDDIRRTYQQMQAMNPEGGERNGDLATVDRDRRQAQRELP